MVGLAWADRAFEPDVAALNSRPEGLEVGTHRRAVRVGQPVALDRCVEIPIANRRGSSRHLSFLESMHRLYAARREPRRRTAFDFGALSLAQSLTNRGQCSRPSLAENPTDNELPEIAFG